MADTIIVGCRWNAAEPDIYYFSLAVDNGVEAYPVVLTPSSVVFVERQVGVNWSADLPLTVAEYPAGSGTYAIRTTIPPIVANGQERILRITVDGTVYGPWSFAFSPPT